MSSLFTIKSHKESLFPIIWLFCCVSLVVIAPVMTYVSRQIQLLFFFFFFFDLLCFRQKKCRFFCIFECNFRNWEFHSKIAQRRRMSVNPSRVISLVHSQWFGSNVNGLTSFCTFRRVYVCNSGSFWWGNVSEELDLKENKFWKSQSKNWCWRQKILQNRTQRRRKSINPRGPDRGGLRRLIALCMQKKETISYGGATEDMKLANRFHFFLV